MSRSSVVSNTHDARLTTHDFISPLGPFEPSPTIAVALSGGPDSMALTLLADAWTKQHHGRVIALTIDHGLRPESRTEAEQVAGWMRQRHIEHHILTPIHTEAGNNVMQAARTWRYDALAQWCRAHHVLHCLLAHHADDQLETMLLHQSRGNTADGASAMAHIRPYAGVRFLRPLLGVKKSELIAYLHTQQQPWVEDPSNTKEDFARVRLRRQLQQDTTLQSMVQDALLQAQTERTGRETQLAVAAMQCVNLHPAGFAVLQREAWQQLPSFLADQLLADILRCVSGATTRARRHEITRLSHALRLEPHTKRTLQQCEINAGPTHIRIAREAARVEAPILLKGRGQCRWDQRFHVTYDIPPDFTLTLRALGAAGRRILRSQHRIPAEIDIPLATPSLWHLDELLSAPHIAQGRFPPELQVRIGFAPAKSLAAMPFW